MNLRLPSITGATVGERLEQVVRYLFSLVNDLNFALGQREQEKLPQTAENESTEENNRLRPESVTTDILADGAVTNDKIADGTIDKSKTAFSVPSLLDIYPVGAIYLSVSSTSPETLFGGKWEQIQNRFLLAAGSSYSAGATGGEATHTLTTNEMPSHAHDFARGDGTYTKYAIVDMAKSTANQWGVHWETQNGYWCNNGQMQNAGGGAAHNNMPPYLAVYMWKRTA